MKKSDLLAGDGGRAGKQELGKEGGGKVRNKKLSGEGRGFYRQLFRERIHLLRGLVVYCRELLPRNLRSSKVCAKARR